VRTHRRGHTATRARSPGTLGELDDTAATAGKPHSRCSTPQPAQPPTCLTNPILESSLPTTLHPTTPNEIWRPIRMTQYYRHDNRLSFLSLELFTNAVSPPSTGMAPQLFSRFGDSCFTSLLLFLFFLRFTLGSLENLRNNTQRWACGVAGKLEGGRVGFRDDWSSAGDNSSLSHLTGAGSLAFFFQVFCHNDFWFLWLLEESLRLVEARWDYWRDARRRRKKMLRHDLMRNAIGGLRKCLAFGLGLGLARYS
jgi:hypothetical protein